MFKSIAVLSLFASTAYGHAFISSVKSTNGVSAMSFGVDTTGAIPRNGTTEQPFQLDTPVLKDLNTNPCGSTLQGGSIDITQALKAQEQANNGALPAVESTVTLGLHQVNADGGGPFTAEVNEDGTGKTWVAATVTKQPPGENGLLHNGPADSELTLQLPNNLKCTGGTNGNACLIRITNGGENSTSFANGAGPFGGCVAVSQANAATGSSSGTAAKSTITAAAGGNGNTSSNNRKGGSNRAKNNAIMQGRRSLLSGRSIASIDELSELVAKREMLNRNINEKRQLLTAQLIDELETATGTAIDIPIDKLAGHDDFAAKGGNSTEASKDAVLTTQQAIDLKKAVQLAIDSALIVMANGNIDAGKQGQSSEITDKANADAAASLAAGETTSVNLGNAGVGFFNTANVDSLLGELATASDSIAATLTSGSGAAATATLTDTAATATATSTQKTGSNRTKGSNNGAANRNGNNRGGNSAAATRKGAFKNRVRSWDA
ncbi:hypothetical protein GLOTRDRAFT_115770 [Gloeophyllum trabeum ATCC 11539]|uniref:Uncharacterized protein n=1 Tax=Gloeophyllum trabeum (strain ATCC 11539 / FP-39264 / Madison 617) TaxID=670483 RepID=S7Q9G2_GLOTA|nr:uncharacterized protein GLOTRDRAFT_115770 [Gloeophyllum trabeum ATCC 11539]EPQ56561.1 hypothetical protein GLOTRDRAFT_115770 [Gloeophyllum trabeum ATCC 11539]